jgi:hypothetical protein
MTSDHESPFVLEPIQRAPGGQPALAPPPSLAARDRTALEGPFELEALERPESWGNEAEAREPIPEQLAPIDSARPERQGFPRASALRPSALRGLDSGLAATGELPWPPGSCPFSKVFR